MQDSSQDVSAFQPLAFPEIVSFPTEVDVTISDRVGDGLLAAFHPGVTVVIADLSRTTFCDASGIRCLLLARNHAVCTGSELRVVVGENAVLRALNVSGADQSLNLYRDMQAALTGAPSVPAARGLSETRGIRLFEIPASRLFEIPAAKFG